MAMRGRRKVDIRADDREMVAVTRTAIDFPLMEVSGKYLIEKSKQSSWWRKNKAKLALVAYFDRFERPEGWSDDDCFWAARFLNYALSLTQNIGPGKLAVALGGDEKTGAMNEEEEILFRHYKAYFLALSTYISSFNRDPFMDDSQFAEHQQDASKRLAQVEAEVKKLQPKLINAIHVLMPSLRAQLLSLDFLFGTGNTLFDEPVAVAIPDVPAAVPQTSLAWGREYDPPLEGINQFCSIGATG